MTFTHCIIARFHQLQLYESYTWHFENLRVKALTQALLDGNIGYIRLICTFSFVWEKNVSLFLCKSFVSKIPASYALHGNWISYECKHKFP